MYHLYQNEKSVLKHVVIKILSRYEVCLCEMRARRTQCPRADVGNEMLNKLRSEQHYSNLYAIKVSQFLGSTRGPDAFYND